MLAGRRVGKALAVLVALVLAPAGCSVVQGTFTTVRALDDAGFSSPQIDVRGGDRYEVTVEKDTEDLDAAAVEAAGVVWRNLPLRVERLEVTCTNGFGGSGEFSADRAELEERFGPRDADLDRGVQERDLRTIALVVAGVMGLGVLVLIAIVVLVVVLTRRNRRPDPPPGPPGGWGTQGPPPGYGPPS